MLKVMAQVETWPYRAGMPPLRLLDSVCIALVPDCDSADLASHPNCSEGCPCQQVSQPEVCSCRHGGDSSWMKFFPHLLGGLWCGVSSWGLQADVNRTSAGCWHLHASNNTNSAGPSNNARGTSCVPMAAPLSWDSCALALRQCSCTAGS